MRVNRFQLAALLLALAAGAMAAQAPAPPARRPAPAAKPPSSAPSPADLKYPPLRPIHIPDVETVTLPNGMKIFLLEDHELPVVGGAARIRTGNLFDPPDKVGLADITGEVMRSGGTHDRTGDQLDEELENIAASVEAGIGESSGSVSFSALKENTDEVLRIFHDVLTAPEFRQDKVDLIKSQLRSAISRRNDNAGGIAEREFTNTVYGRQTPYGWSMEYNTIGRIMRTDLVAFHKRYFFPANVMLAVWGDFSSAEMKAKIENLFGGWDARQEPVPAFPKVEDKPAPGIFLAQKADVTQTFFAVGQLGGEMRDKDLAAVEIMADILGGGFQSRLVQRVRTQMGAAYDISASWAPSYDHPGSFEISGSTKSLSTLETLQAIQEEIAKIRTTEVSDSELETARQTALNSLVFAFDTRTKTLGRLLNYEYFGYPRDFIQQYQKTLAAVTKADVLKAAREHIDPAKLTYVVVGKPEEFGKPLATLGLPVASIDLTIPPATLEAAQSDAASLDEGRKLLQKAQQAVGGVDKLTAVIDVTEVSEFQLEAAAGGMHVQQVNRWVAPESFRQESTLPTGKVTAYTDGKIGWIATPQGSGPLVGPQLKQVQGDLFRLYFRLLRSDSLPERKVNYVGDNTIEITDGTGSNARLVVDPQTGLPRKMVYETVHVTGPPVTVEDRYTNFQDVAGVKVPFGIAIVQGGRKFADVTVKECKVNQGLKAEELNKRP